MRNIGLARYAGRMAIGLALTAMVGAQAAGPELTAIEAYRLAQAGKLTLIDIRTPSEWRQTGVPRGTLLIDMRHPRGPDGFAEAVLSQVGGDRDAPIALICRTGNRTTYMQRLLQERGFTRVYNVREGMIGSAAGPGWIRQGLPVEPCAC